MMMSTDTGIIEFNEGWDIIQNGILKLINILKTDLKGDFPVTEYINIYTTVYKMCTQRRPYVYSQQLYDKYRISLEEYVAVTILPALGEVHDQFLLKEVEKCWGNYHKVLVRLISNMFIYLDLYFVRQNSLVSLVKVGVMCFRDVVYHGIKINVKNVVIELINREREGEQIDRALLRNIVNFFVEMGMDRLDLYQKDFEAPMLEDTGAYYSRKGSLWILEEDSCPDYMIKAEECLRREKERVAHYLHSSSEQKLLEKVENEILSRYYIQLLENKYSGCHVLLTNDKKDDLSRMYRLFCRIPQSLEPFASIFKQHVISEGIKLFKWVEDVVKNKNNNIDDIPAHEFVEKIIEVHDKCSGYVVEAFQRSNIFYKALRDAFEVICDKKVEESTCAEFLATFCDNVLKKSGLSDDHIEGILEKAANLLQYVSDRDLFAEFYRKKLASRLLHHKSANESHERAMLSKIKDQCGLQLTSKMKGMVNDFTLARETQPDFNTYLHDYSNVHPGIELTVTVLNNGFWPTYKLFNLNPPAEILKCIRACEGFYSTKYQHRKLTWMYCLGNCKLIGNFDTKPIEIAVSTNQAVMLLLFNDFERLSCEEISSQLNLGEEDVIRLLHSFVCGKYKIILKEPVTQTITKTDSFEFNASFTCKSARIKISLPKMDEKKRVSEVVDGDRCHAIDAAIVRTMKARKVLSSQELFVECVEQLQATFKPKVKLMQKQIEDLISREFIERDKENSNIVRYIA